MMNIEHLTQLIMNLIDRIQVETIDINNFDEEEVYELNDENESDHSQCSCETETDLYFYDCEIDDETDCE
jgi:hypothetical protein